MRRPARKKALLETIVAQREEAWAWYNRAIVAEEQLANAWAENQRLITLLNDAENDANRAVEEATRLRVELAIVRGQL